MIFSCGGMVWGVDWIHLVGVGVGIKKTRGGNLNYYVYTYIANL